MSAYLATFISGNENFGGYLSVDGEKAFPITHEWVFKLMPGHHHFKIYSTSNAERNVSAVQSFLRDTTSSSGFLLDTIQDHQISKGEGESWEFNAIVEDNEVLSIGIISKDRSIIGNPIYNVIELTDEEIEYYENLFDELERQEEEKRQKEIEIRERKRNSPRRNPLKIVFGSIHIFIGFIGLLVVLVNQSSNISLLIGMLSILIIGLSLFASGMKKKIRNTPRSSPAKIVVGIILMYIGFIGLLGCLSSLSNIAQIITEDPIDVLSPLIGILPVPIIGFLLFVSGMKKKIEK